MVVVVVVSLAEKVGPEELVHREHGHSRVTAHHLLERRVAHDLTLVGGVLEVVLADVLPERLDDLQRVVGPV